MSAISTFVLDGVKDPSTLAWPPTLPIELALKTATPEELRKEYGFSREEWDLLPKNPVFIKDLTQACEMVRQEGMSFKLKARLIAEENLKALFSMVHDDGKITPPAVKAKLIELAARWAGYDPKSMGENAGTSVATGLNIQINLGKDY